jgi:hypothetical protein
VDTACRLRGAGTKVVLKTWNLRKQHMRACGVDSRSSVCCEDGSEPSRSLNGREFLEYLCTHRLVKRTLLFESQL